VNRRLNPDLFGPNQTSPETEEYRYSAVVTRQLQSDLKTANKRISHLESLLEVVQSQMSTMSQNNDRRTEAFSKALSELERDFREQNLATRRSQKVIEDKFRDQRIRDGQIESMIDRFNSNLSHFENKLASLQKVISEKEMSLISYRRIIEQIVDEVEKLKRSGRSPHL
jgi:chromosome segregation ATPase